MEFTARYLTHPQVAIDPKQDIQRWSLNKLGHTRVMTLAQSNALTGTTRVISSAETKAIETATPIANALGCDLEIKDNMHENDRSATGYLPPEEFERVADQFFADPENSVRRWETAIHAQQRIVAEVKACLSSNISGDILFVGHGGVGTLLFCFLAQIPINREYDQAPGGGNYFQFPTNALTPTGEWKSMEELAM